MTKRSLFVFAIVNTLVVALAAAYLTTKWHNHHQHHIASVGEESNFHRWLHIQLNLTPEQEASLRPVEEEFERKSLQIRERIKRASQNLAGAMKSENPDHPQIESALHEISSHQTELKRLMITHFFEMKRHLDPKQAEKIRHWIHDSLTSHSTS